MVSGHGPQSYKAWLRGGGGEVCNSNKPGRFHSWGLGWRVGRPLLCLTFGKWLWLPSCSPTQGAVWLRLCASFCSFKASLLSLLLPGIFTSSLDFQSSSLPLPIHTETTSYLEDWLQYLLFLKFRFNWVSWALFFFFFFVVFVKYSNSSLGRFWEFSKEFPRSTLTIYSPGHTMAQFPSLGSVDQFSVLPQAIAVMAANLSEVNLFSCFRQRPSGENPQGTSQNCWVTPTSASRYTKFCLL